MRFIYIEQEHLFNFLSIESGHFGYDYVEYFDPFESVHCDPFDFEFVHFDFEFVHFDFEFGHFDFEFGHFDLFESDYFDGSYLLDK